MKSPISGNNYSKVCSNTLSEVGLARIALEYYANVEIEMWTISEQERSKPLFHSIVKLQVWYLLMQENKNIFSVCNVFYAV